MIFFFRFWNLAKTLQILRPRTIVSRACGSAIEVRLSNNNYSNNLRRCPTTFKFKINKTTFPTEATTTISTAAAAATMWSPAVTLVDWMLTFLSPTNFRRRRRRRRPTVRRIRNFLTSTSFSRTLFRRRSGRRTSTLFNPSTCWTSNSSSRSSKTSKVLIECRQLRRRQQTSVERITDFRTTRLQNLRLFQWERFESSKNEFLLFRTFYSRQYFTFTNKLGNLKQPIVEIRPIAIKKQLFSLKQSSHSELCQQKMSLKTSFCKVSRSMSLLT